MTKCWCAWWPAGFAIPTLISATAAGPARSCGGCRPCRNGRPTDCQRFWEANFGFARLDGTSALRGGVRGHFLGQSSFATHALATMRHLERYNLAALLRPARGLLVFLQRRQLLLGFLGVGAMHHFRILPEHALGVALGKAVVGGALGPGIAVRVERDTFDAQPLAALLEFR